MLGHQGFEGLELRSNLRLGQQVIQFKGNRSGVQGLGTPHRGLRRLGPQGIQIGLQGFLPLFPLEQPIQIVSQFHLGLEHVRLHPLADFIAGLGHLDHLLPELLVLLNNVESGIGQGQAPIVNHHLGPDLVGLVPIRQIVRFGLLRRHFRTETPLAGKGEFLGQLEHFLGHGVLIQSPGVGGNIVHAEGYRGVLQGSGRFDGFLGGARQRRHLLHFGIGLEGLSDEGLQIRRQAGIGRLGPGLTAGAVAQAQPQPQHPRCQHIPALAALHHPYPPVR